MRLRDTFMESKDEEPITFAHIHDGEVFMFEDAIFLKLADEVNICDEDTDNIEVYNAVYLSDGELACFDITEQVERFVIAPELIYDSDKTITHFSKS